MNRSLAELRAEVKRLEAELAAREAVEAVPTPAEPPAEPPPVAPAAPQPAPAVAAPEPAAKPAAGGPPILTAYELALAQHHLAQDEYAKEMRRLSQMNDNTGKDWWQALMFRVGRTNRFPW